MKYCLNQSGSKLGSLWTRPVSSRAFDVTIDHADVGRGRNANDASDVANKQLTAWTIHAFCCTPQRKAPSSHQNNAASL